MINGSDGTVYNITSATPRPPLDGRMIRLRDRNRQSQRLPAGHRARPYPLDSGPAEMRELRLRMG
jgi:hypothetical protein